jgi:hypothetical protein
MAKKNKQKNVYISLRVKKELADELDAKIKNMWEKEGITISRSELMRRILKNGIEKFENSNIEPENVTQCNTNEHIVTQNVEEKTGISGKANIEPESQKKSIWAETIEEIVDKVPLSEIEISSIEQLRRDYETSTGIEQGQVIAYMDDLIEQINYNAFKEVGK